jgi:hypothetical protein
MQRRQFLTGAAGERRGRAEGGDGAWICNGADHTRDGGLRAASTYLLDGREPAARCAFVDRTVWGCDRVGQLPGSKLYLLLQKEMQAVGVPAKRSLRQVLLPNTWPPAIELGTPGEDLADRIRRYRRQLQFIVFRLRFHTCEGLRYLWESVRWRQQKKRYLSRSASLDRLEASARRDHDNVLTES